MQSSHTLGATWTGAKGVRLSRIFMFPVKPADLPKVKPHAACRLLGVRAYRLAAVHNGQDKPVKYSVGTQARGTIKDDGLRKRV